MKEGSLDAPIRHPLEWESEAFYDRNAIETEMERVFDICHGCRRCFNLCDSFPTLFDMIDDTEDEVIEAVDKKEYKKVVDGCTLCDMCFLTKCPYVPPHDFNLDFPHLMLRYRALEHKEGNTGFTEKQITNTDRVGKLASKMPGITNWATKRDNGLTRPVMEAVTGIDKRAELPKFAPQTLEQESANAPLEINKSAPAYGQKVALYATCYGNYNTPEVGMAARKILAHNGVESIVIYPECCGMPQLEQGDLGEVSAKAKRVAEIFKPYIDDGYKVLATVPSCALMMKFEWPLINSKDESVKLLSQNAKDVSEYIIWLKNEFGLADGLKPMAGDVSLHIACHSRAQNFGQKGAEILRLIPEMKLNVVERCSGHGGSWGIMKKHFDTGMKQGKPVFKKMAAGGDKQNKRYIASECPLAGLHIAQGVEAEIPNEDERPELRSHPILMLAEAWGL
ncbi:MAG: heterodisulfide reductase-related iron-sulfur binding cluster [Alphaproteobacteria bacterium]